MGRLFLVCVDFDGLMDGWGRRNGKLRLVDPACLSKKLFKGLIPDVCFGKFRDGLFTIGVLLSGFVVRCCSCG